MRDAHHVPASIIRSQLASVFETRAVAAVKIGMLGTRATVEAVASSLPSGLDVPIVLDPVLASSSGAELLDREGLRAMRALLLPRVTLLTPNLPEAATLVGAANPAVSRTEILQQGQALLRSGPRAVLIKGGHASGDLALDYFFGSDQSMQTLAAPRLEHTARGTGCTLASAIAAELASGVALPDACTRAKRYVTRYLMRAAPAARAPPE
jgi:hydroxymethylpyrimidine/phosphomethylpyrimidine kinase